MALELVDVKVGRERKPAITDKMVAPVRALLPLQQGYTNVSHASAEFGLLMSGREIADRVAQTLPVRGEWRVRQLALGLCLLAGLWPMGHYVMPAKSAQEGRDCARFVGAIFGSIALFGGGLTALANARRRVQQ